MQTTATPLTLAADLSSVESAIYQLLHSWYDVESDGLEVPASGYPFHESLEEIAANLSAYRETVQAWAEQARTR